MDKYDCEQKVRAVSQVRALHNSAVDRTFQCTGYGSNSTWLDSTRLDTFDFVEPVEPVEQVETSVSSQSSSTCRASRASRARRVERVELCSSTSSTQPNAWARRVECVESSRVESSRVEPSGI